MGNPIPCTFKYGDRPIATIGHGDVPQRGAGLVHCGQRQLYQAVFQTGTLDGTPVFYPVDGDNFTPAAERSTATIGPPYEPTGGYPVEGRRVAAQLQLHQRGPLLVPVRRHQDVQLEFRATTTSGCSSTRRLAVDSAGSTAAGRVGHDQRRQRGEPRDDERHVYEARCSRPSATRPVVVQAHAERSRRRRRLRPICGDGLVTPPEQCDNGTANNTGGYNKCTADCKLGPYCGDAMVTDGEHATTAATTTAAARLGCGPGCKLPARCGDCWSRPSTASSATTAPTAALRRLHHQCQRAALLRRRQGAEPAGAVRRRRQRRHLRQLRRSDDAAAELPVRPALRRRRRAGPVRRAVRADVDNDPNCTAGLPASRGSAAMASRRRPSSATTARSTTTANMAAARRAASWRPTAATASRTGRKTATTASTTTATAAAHRSASWRPTAVTAWPTRPTSSATTA